MIPTRLAPLALLGYVLLRGCDATVLKWLQERDAATLLRTAGGEDPISFGNVFFFSNLATGLVVLLLNRGCLKRQLPKLVVRDRSILLLRAVLGSLIGPICYFLALQHLSVISQTLLFTLIPSHHCAAGEAGFRRTSAQAIWAQSCVTSVGLGNQPHR